MESWRLVWREGIAPTLPRVALETLAVALESDDPRLTQGSGTTPPPLKGTHDWPAEAADVFGFCGAVLHGGFGKATVGQCEAYFARTCFETDLRVKEIAAARWFLNWFDDTPRDEMRRELLAEVKLALASA